MTPTCSTEIVFGNTKTRTFTWLGPVTGPVPAPCPNQRQSHAPARPSRRPTAHRLSLDCPHRSASMTRLLMCHCHRCVTCKSLDSNDRQRRLQHRHVGGRLTGSPASRRRLSEGRRLSGWGWHMSRSIRPSSGKHILHRRAGACWFSLPLAAFSVKPHSSCVATCSDH